MKKYILFTFFILIPSFLWAAAESKPASNTPSGPSFNDVSSKVSQAFCSKMEQCASQKIPMNQCVGQMNDTFIQSYKSLPVDKKIQVSADQLSQCVKSIQGSTCETLQKASNLTGCDFIGQLSS